MTGGFVLGAFALNEEPEMIEIEGAGISLLLPDSWEGRYICEQSAGEIAVYREIDVRKRRDRDAFLYREDRGEPSDGLFLSCAGIYDRLCGRIYSTIWEWLQMCSMIRKIEKS